MDTNILAVPRTTAELLNRVSVWDRHPGLQLDKFCQVPTKQEFQKEALKPITETKGDSRLLESLFARRNAHLSVLNAAVWHCETAGPLTLHLSRASALENAGICLHPIYGFVYLPGSGLKGMARAYAETIWLVEQPDKAAAWNTIESVFGWAPHSDDKNKKEYKPKDSAKHGTGDEACAGRVVFHDAWPEQWPQLHLDIVNNHHVEYYQGKDAPGDWEDPTMMSFLAVGPGEVFSFALSKRRPVFDDMLIAQAREWLTGALCHLGAGAKTAAGYGAFKPVEGPIPALTSSAVKTYETELELVTPAFLAGPLQSAEDCDLRPATLRGLLRWWWRTMHAAHVDLDTLRALEAAVWGDTNQSGPVRITVEPVGSPVIGQPNFKELSSKDGKTRLDFSNKFAEANGIEIIRGKTTQPLIYAAYGMDEMKSSDLQTRKQRYCALPGSRWRVKMMARRGFFKYDDNKSPLPAESLLSQVHASLWLFCHFGGVGSRSRKGFGSFADISGMTIDECKLIAKRFRENECCLKDKKIARPQSSSLDMFECSEVNTTWTNAWYVLDHMGGVMQDFAQASPSTNHGKHCEEKIALGLPRQIHGPRNSPLRHQSNHTPPKKLECDKGKRYSSPVHFHVAKDDNGALRIRIAAFPAEYLPDFDTSKAFLREYLDKVTNNLHDRVKQFALQGKKSARGTQFGGIGVSSQSCDLRRGERVRTILIEDPKGKGRPFAKLEGDERIGNIKNPEQAPPGVNIGDTVELEIDTLSHDQKNIQFRWPTAQAPENLKKPKPGGKGGPGHGPGGFFDNPRGGPRRGAGGRY